MQCLMRMGARAFLLVVFFFKGSFSLLIAVIAHTRPLFPFSFSLLWKHGHIARRCLVFFFFYLLSNDAHDVLARIRTLNATPSNKD